MGKCIHGWKDKKLEVEQLFKEVLIKQIHVGLHVLERKQINKARWRQSVEYG